MRTSVGFLAAAALCLGAASAHAQGIQFAPFTTNSPPPQYAPFTTNGPQIHQPFSNMTPTPPSGVSQAKFPAPGSVMAGPSRLMNLLPHFGGISNTHYIGASVFPTQTDQYLAQFGYQRLR